MTRRVEGIAERRDGDGVYRQTTDGLPIQNRDRDTPARMPKQKRGTSMANHEGYVR